MLFWVCSLVGRAVASKAAGRGFDSLRTRNRLNFFDLEIRL